MIALSVPWKLSHWRTIWLAYHLGRKASPWIGVGEEYMGQGLKGTGSGVEEHSEECLGLPLLLDNAS